MLCCVNRILHFVLFILACIALHKWRKSRSLPERLEAGNDLDGTSHTEFQVTRKEAASNNSIAMPVRNDRKRASEEIWEKPELPGQGIAALHEDPMAELPGQGVLRSMVISRAELPVSIPRRTVCELPAIAIPP